MKLSGHRCKCSTVGGGCGKFFNSDAAFVKHRTGTHGKSRRCLDSVEMQEKGMAVSAAGYWVTALKESDHHA